MGDATTGLAVVTGAASGMGEAAAKLLREAGWALLLCDINGERLAASAAALGGEADLLAGDIAGAGFAADLAAAAGGRPIGAVIHCAGLSPTMADPARILEVNLAATMRLFDAVRPLMAEGGSIVAFASSAAHLLGTALDEQIGKVTTPEAVPELLALSPESGMAYSVSKRAVQLVAQREAFAFGKRNVRVNTISPGVIDTPMGRAEMKLYPFMQAMIDNSALGRAARSEEVAAVAVFLCSPAASFVTGTDILVAGGLAPVVMPE